MCSLSPYQWVLQVAGVFGLAFLLALLVFYGVEWAGFKWKNTAKGEQK